mmetsp:Transcript_100792/g.308161  ORF Transcript_100792/g.308161 Transcript_100792/m.308161 type:complete len:232 (-) Transcript_100792:273-968(-)
MEAPAPCTSATCAFNSSSIDKLSRMGTSCDWGSVATMLIDWENLRSPMDTSLSVFTMASSGTGAIEPAPGDSSAASFASAASLAAIRASDRMSAAARALSANFFSKASMLLGPEAKTCSVPASSAAAVEPRGAFWRIIIIVALKRRADRELNEPDLKAVRTSEDRCFKRCANSRSRCCSWARARKAWTNSPMRCFSSLSRSSATTFATSCSGCGDSKRPLELQRQKPQARW